LLAIFLIILSPLLLFFFLTWLIVMPFITLANLKSYKKSEYYKEFKKPFSNKIFDSNEYAFYNYAIEEKLPIKYVKQTNKPLNYFIYGNNVFIFPDFNEIKYNDEKQCWEVIYRKYKETSTKTLEEYLKNKIDLFENKIELPVKLFVSRNYFDEEYLDISKLPESLYVVRNYVTGLGVEDIESLSIVPHTTRELYKMMLLNKKLGGQIQILDDELIVWTFEKFICEIALDDREGYLRILKNNKIKMEITHWHPEHYEVYDEVCQIGEMGNVLVIKTFAGSAQVLYMGPKEKCNIKAKRIKLGKLHYFEIN
jgi:hypothetical protein